MGYRPSWAVIGWARVNAGLKGEVESAKAEITKIEQEGVCVCICYLRMVYCAWSIVAVAVVAVSVYWLMKKLVVIGG